MARTKQGNGQATRRLGASQLSQAQFRLLCAAARADGDRTPFLGNRRAGAHASAWYRTATSLAALGLVTLEREGDARRARVTEAGRMALEGRKS